ncbi:heavy metal-binding domain-containing protein [Mucilaginibacter sp. PAMB04168]|uniref:heavy metal-binding domain-containing protein n=1 Tax=Mucilaginibacter sp. PAMB04168 TaxID=3138567 RepID=UPI0031F69C07
MKKLSILCLMITLAACNQSSQTKTIAPNNEDKTVYTCTMHPDVKADKPGICPQCGMDLVEKN